MLTEHQDMGAINVQVMFQQIFFGISKTLAEHIVLVTLGWKFLAHLSSIGSGAAGRLNRFAKIL